jgi:Fe-S cluster biogenesis protein NfuA
MHQIIEEKPTTNDSLMIEYCETPNPNTMKFYATGFLISPGILIEFDRKTKNINSKLAKDLLELDYIETVFYGYDFISISKNDLKDWQEILSEIIFIILRHEYDIVNNSLLDSAGVEDDDDDVVEFDEKDKKTVDEILEFLDDVVRPQVAMDGGDVKLKAYKDGISYFKLKGACGSCPSAGVTLYQGIRQLLIENIPDVVDVEQI